MTDEQISEATHRNLEIAMRALARAGALEEERWGRFRVPDEGQYRAEIDALHNSGAYWMAARAWCSELGRDMDALRDGARRYALQVIAGNCDVA